MEHTLKTDHEVFQAVWEAKKTYELRKNDRNFQVGDTLDLAETVYTGAEMAPRLNGAFPGETIPGKPLEYTGRHCYFKVTHILNGPIYGLTDGWCIMSIVPEIPYRDYPSPLYSDCTSEKTDPATT
jgi:hypothetical protein